MKNKYEFTGDILEHNGYTLQRIRALVDIPRRAKVGDLGGWIESEDNLSQHYGNAWVSGNAKVYGDAKVWGYAEVYGNAEVYNNAKVCDIAEVYDSAEVFGDAKVYGDAEVCGKTWVNGRTILRDGKNKTTQSYICVDPIGSQEAFTTLNLTTGTICTGCFKGTIDEFEANVKATHGDNEHGKNYMGLISYFREIMSNNNTSWA